jgi:SAM-dependent methyltransferase
MLEFYNLRNISEIYTAFRGDGDNNEGFFDNIRENIVTRISNDKKRCRILEIGPGAVDRSEQFADIRDRVELDVYDVTSANREILKKWADNIYIGGKLPNLKVKYDVIFSFFCYEHICEPRDFLDEAISCLREGGSLFIVAPRYDFPFYLSPSSRHLKCSGKICLSFWLLFQRINALLFERPKFIVHLDPALFHENKFRRDIDAVHWVSRFDLDLYVKRKEGATVEHISSRSNSLIEFLWKKYFVLYSKISYNGNKIQK